MALLIPLLRFLVISRAREIAEDQRSSCRVFRFSSAAPGAISPSLHPSRGASSFGVLGHAR
jgi:hypothetical protein